MRKQFPSNIDHDHHRLIINKLSYKRCVALRLRKEPRREGISVDSLKKRKNAHTNMMMGLCLMFNVGFGLAMKIRFIALFRFMKMVIAKWLTWKYL